MPDTTSTPVTGPEKYEDINSLFEEVLAGGRAELDETEIGRLRDIIAIGGAGDVSLENNREFGMVTRKGGIPCSAELDDSVGNHAGTTGGYIEVLAELGRYYSPSNTETGYVIEELRPDSSCRVSRTAARPLPRPVEKIDKVLHPGSIGIVGVSGAKINFGRIILRNIIASGYDKNDMLIIKPGGDEEIDGVRCVPDMASLDTRMDLFIVAVGAAAVFDIVDEVIASDAAEAVLLIPGGLGETEASREPVSEMMSRINKAHGAANGGPVFLGGNCLGVVSHPGNFDSWFIPKELLPSGQRKERRNSAMVSQSGAFMITRLSKNAWLDPAYMAAIGNQNDITHGDMLEYFAGRDDIDVIGFYVEGFRELDGLAFAKATRKALAAGKQVVVYKAGQTAAGQGATMGHTASVAGDYDVCKRILDQAGAIVARDFDEFNDLMYIASTLHDKTFGGNRIAGVSGAGFETVGIADSIGEGEAALQMAEIEAETVERLSEILRAKRLDALMEVRNPFDINPGADDEAHLQCTAAFADDPNVDAVVVGLDPLSPVTRTLDKSAREGHDIHSDESLASIFPGFVKTCNKPVVGIIEGGPMFEPFAAKLMDQGVCVFRSTHRGVNALARYTRARLRGGAS
jgi:acyl-CoA synthetase (NDP forming)